MFTSLRPKVERGSFNSFINKGAEEDTKKKSKKKSSGGLFDDDSDDDSNDDDEEDSATPADATASSSSTKTKKGTGAYLKRMLQEEATDSELLESISDLKVAGMLTTEVDTAGGLIDDDGDAAKAMLQKTSTLLDTTDEKLLEIREDDDLDLLMAATQVKESLLPSGNLGKDGDEDDGMDLFRVDPAAGGGGGDDDDDDDLFSMMGGGDGDGAESGGGGGGGDDLFSIDSYISNQSSGGGLFD